MAISNGIGQFVTTCCLLFNQEIVPSLNVAWTLGYIKQYILQSLPETVVPNICISYLSTLQLVKVSCQTSNTFCENWGSHSSVAEHSSLLRCDIVSLGE